MFATCMMGALRNFGRVDTADVAARRVGVGMGFGVDEDCFC